MPTQPLALVYGLDQLPQRVALPDPMKHWTMTRLRVKRAEIDATAVPKTHDAFFKISQLVVFERAGVIDPDLRAIRNRSSR